MTRRQISKRGAAAAVALSTSLGLATVAALGAGGGKPAKPAAAAKADEEGTAKAAAIVRKAEELRFLGKSRADVELRTKGGDGEIAYLLDVITSSDKRAYLAFLAPKEEKGRKMLAKDKQYWTTFPDSKRVVAISKKELIGNSAFAMADIFQIDAENDYTPRIVGEETENGKQLIKLDLVARSDEAPYYRIEYWVEKDGYFPSHARMYARSGRALKAMFVESRREFAGKLRPETTRMEDEAQKGHVSWWKNRDLVPVDAPDQVFTTEYLGRRN